MASSAAKALNHPLQNSTVSPMTLSWWDVAQRTDHILSCLYGYPPNTGDPQSYAGQNNLGSVRAGWKTLHQQTAARRPFDVEEVCTRACGLWELGVAEFGTCIVMGSRSVDGGNGGGSSVRCAIVGLNHP